MTCTRSAASGRLTLLQPHIGYPGHAFKYSKTRQIDPDYPWSLPWNSYLLHMSRSLSKGLLKSVSSIFLRYHLPSSYEYPACHRLTRVALHSENTIALPTGTMTLHGVNQHLNPSFDFPYGQKTCRNRRNKLAQPLQSAIMGPPGFLQLPGIMCVACR